MPLSIKVLVAPVTLQFSVDDWPRSIDVGSAVNDATTGAAGGGGAGCSTGAGGGGGGGGGAFFLQAAANMASVRQIPIEVILRLFSMNKFLLSRSWVLRAGTRFTWPIPGSNSFRLWSTA